MRPILSVNALAWRLGVPRARLEVIAARIDSHYDSFPIWQNKAKTKVRIVRDPSTELKTIQRAIKDRILNEIRLAEAVHGGVKRRSPRSNASEHLHQPCVINLDVQRFYDKISHVRVYRMFRHEFGFGKDVARLLTRLTTFNGQVPQGAPTSTAIANAFLAEAVDRPLSIAAAKIGARYTRFVDDIALSGANPRPLINLVGQALSTRGLPIHRKKSKPMPKEKLKIRSARSAQEVTGLNVNAPSGPSVPRYRRDNVRAAIKALFTTPKTTSGEHDLKSVRGRIAHVKQHNPGSADRLQRYLQTQLHLRT